MNLFSFFFKLNEKLIEKLLMIFGGGEDIRYLNKSMYIFKKVF